LEARPVRAAELVFERPQAFFECIGGAVGLLAGEDERGAEAQAVGAAAEGEEAALEGEHFETVAELGGALFGSLVADELDADHEAEAADGADVAETLGPGSQAGHEVVADEAGVFDEFFFEQVQSGERGGDGDGVAAEGGGVGAGRPIHDVRTGDHGRKGHAAGDAFGERDNVGDNAEVLGGEHAAGAAHAGLDFVVDEQDAVLVGDAAELLVEAPVGHQVAAFALDGLDDDGGDFFGRQDGFEETLFEIFDGGGAADSGIFVRKAVAIGVGDVIDGQHGAEAAALDDFAAGEGKRAHGAAMEASEESDELVAAGVHASEFESGFDGLGAGVAEVDAAGEGAGREMREAFG